MRAFTLSPSLPITTAPACWFHVRHYPGGDILGDHTVVAANSVVTKSFPEGNVLLVGMPASEKAELPDWFHHLKRRVNEEWMQLNNLKLKCEYE